MNEQILSPSAMIMYDSCPYAFKLRYIDRYKPLDESNDYLKAGKSTHLILEKFYSNIKKDTTNPEEHIIDALKKTAFEHWDRTIDARKRDDINNALFLWLQFEIQRFKRYKEIGILDRFFPLATEEDLTDYNKKLRAIIDKRCIGQNGSIYAIDYKTDKNLPAQRNFKGKLNEIDNKYKIQSALNAIVLESHGIKLNNFYFQFIKYPDKLLSVPLTDELFTEINILIKKIREETTFEKNNKSCFFCSMKLYCKTENTCVHCISQSPTIL